MPRVKALVDQIHHWLCFVSVLWLFLTATRVGLQCVVVLFPGHTHFLADIEFAVQPLPYIRNVPQTKYKSYYGQFRHQLHSASYMSSLVADPDGVQGPIHSLPSPRF